MVTAIEVIDEVAICCGRDAAAEGDRCGLVPGLKGVKLSILEEDTSEGDQGRRAGQSEKAGVGKMFQIGDTFQIGASARRSNGLARLEGNRLVVCVLRDVWYVEIWQV